MSYRARVLVVFTGLVLLPLLAFGLGARYLMLAELRSELQRSADAVVAIAGEDLQRVDRELELRVEAVAADLALDRPMRKAIGGTSPADSVAVRQWLRRSAGPGLPRLWLVVGPDPLTDAVAAIDSLVLVTLESTAGRTAGLARTATFPIGLTPVTVVGAVPVDEEFLSRLARSAEIGVVLQYPRGVISSEDAGAPIPGEAVIERSTPLVHVAPDGEIGSAQLVVAHSLAPLAGLRRSVDRWLILALIVTAAGAIIVSLLLSARLTRPIEELAAKTSRLDLDALESNFWTGRLDEIGTLSRMLDEMIGRLRTGADRIRESERQAAVGELARRVNHDIRNGLIPIRNVLDHLSDVSASDPGALSGVFGERLGTLESSVDYLEEIAGSYARPRADPGPAVCQVGHVISEVVRDTPDTPGLEFEVSVADGLPPFEADPSAVRRVLDNLIRNSVESLTDGSGTVSIRAERGGPEVIRLVVGDTGEGMTPDTLQRAFDENWSTRGRGSGLGLSIVRDLVSEIGGSVTANSEPGIGTEIAIELPARIEPGDFA